jgi:phosphoribosyl-AMP cyclohydrolase
VHILDWEKIRSASPDGKGLLAAVIQNQETAEVLMVVYLNEEAWTQTEDTGYVTVYSRKDKALRVQGERVHKGGIDCKLRVHSHRISCGGNALLISVWTAGDINHVCHHDGRSCFA